MRPRPTLQPLHLPVRAAGRPLAPLAPLVDGPAPADHEQLESREWVDHAYRSGSCYHLATALVRRRPGMQLAHVMIRPLGEIERPIHTFATAPSLPGKALDIGGWQDQSQVLAFYQQHYPTASFRVAPDPTRSLYESFVRDGYYAAPSSAPDHLAGLVIDRWLAADLERVPDTAPEHLIPTF